MNNLYFIRGLNHWNEFVKMREFKSFTLHEVSITPHGIAMGGRYN